MNLTDPQVRSRSPSRAHQRTTDLAGEVMVNGQAQSLLLQSNEGRGALLATRNFPVGSPEAWIRRHGAPTYSPTGGGHGAPDALS